MFLFIRLLLAHFIGDFPLQFNFIFKLKLKGLRGVIPHALIIFFCGIAMSWPYLHMPLIWGFLAFIAVTHLIQDSLKINYGKPKHGFWAYVIDQITHASLISLIFFTGLKDLPAPEPSNWFVRLYSHDGLAIYLIILIAATYNGHFLIRCFKDSFVKNANPCDAYEKWFGMFERLAIVSLFLTRLPLWAVILLSLALRPLTYVSLKERLSLHRCFVAVPDMVLSWIIGLAGGMTLYLLQSRYPVY
ncbi:MAG: DUF3307 domain-containing protein [Candidatus Omnitrophica bacterium]|nr:DUF3307 domain-containing protein [Candidatus Omnitrophota bacterium]